MDVGQVCSYCYSGTVKLSEPHPERPRLWTGALSVLYCSHEPDWSYTTGSHIQHFPFFQVLFVVFFSAAAWFSPSISLISSSQPFPVMSSIQQMFFFHVHKETFALTLTFASVSWDGLLLFSSFAAQFWLGTFGLIFLLRDESFAIFLYASGLLTVKTRWLPSCQIQQLHQWP